MSRLVHSARICAAIGAVLALHVAAADDPQPSAGRKLTKADIEGLMSTLSNWGRWGQDDQLGTLNLITPEKRKQAAQLVQDGHSVSMAHDVVKTRTDSSEPFQHRVLLSTANTDATSVGDEYRVQYHGFTQTHLDALCHLFYKGKMYNGFSQSEVTENGAQRLAINRARNGIFTKAVLMDIPQLLGTRYLEGSRAIYPEDLEAWERMAKVKVESGDAVLIRTGRWTRREVAGEWEIMKDSAGLHASCLPWLKERNVAVVGSDLALDVLPSQVEGFELPVHWVVVVAMGTPILDNCDFEAVAAAARERQRWSFLLTVSPLAVEGGTGSPVNPIATF